MSFHLTVNETDMKKIDCEVCFIWSIERVVNQFSQQEALASISVQSDASLHSSSFCPVYLNKCLPESTSLSTNTRTAMFNMI